MGLTRLQGFLSRHNRIALETNIFIYQLQSNPRYVLLTDAIFQWIEHPGHRAVTSTISMTEILVQPHLVQPHRNSEQEMVDQFYAQLATYPNIEWIAPNLAVADIAARIRATHRLLRSPDAIQAGATALVTNDPTFERVPDIETLVLDHFL